MLATNLVRHWWALTVCWSLDFLRAGGRRGKTRDWIASFRQSMRCFADGTPFASREGASQADVGGMFPPSPETVSGAMRAALARCNGWDGRTRRWPRSLNTVLGDGPDGLGQLVFEGPFLLKGSHPLLPVPACVGTE